MCQKLTMRSFVLSGHCVTPMDSCDFEFTLTFLMLERSLPPSLCCETRVLYRQVSKEVAATLVESIRNNAAFS